MKQIFNLYNNNKEIGTVTTQITNIKKFMLLAGLGYLMLTTTGCSREEEQKLVVTIEEQPIEESTYEVEERYKLEYTVQYGDTLTGLVYAYESDANKVYSLIDDIERENKLQGKGLTAGKKITLLGIPGEKLEELGYSADYSLFAPEVELEDRVDFIAEQFKHDRNLNIKYGDKQDEVDEIKERADDLKELYEEYKEALSKDAVVELLDYLLEEYRELCELMEEQMGYSFDDYNKAHPLSMALTNEEAKSLL